MKLYKIVDNTLYRVDGTKLFDFTYFQTDGDGTEFVNATGAMRVTTRRIENLPVEQPVTLEKAIETVGKLTEYRSEVIKKPVKPRKTKQTAA